MKDKNFPIVISEREPKSAAEEAEEAELLISLQVRRVAEDVCSSSVRALFDRRCSRSPLLLINKCSHMPMAR